MTPRDRIEYLKKEMVRALNQQYVCTWPDEVETAIEELLNEYHQQNDQSPTITADGAPDESGNNEKNA